MNVLKINKNLVSQCQSERYVSTFFERPGSILFTERDLLVGLNPELAEYAYQHCVYLSTRTVEEIVLLFMYTTGVYRVLNTYLRTHRIVDENHAGLFFAWCSLQFRHGRYLTASYETMHRVYASEPVTGDLLDHYTQVMNRVIFESPVLPVDLRVTRGTKSETDQTGFISTSLHADVASDMFTGKDCCVYLMTLPRGTHALFMLSVSDHEPEYELLLPTGCVFAVTGAKRRPLPSEYEPDRTMKYISIQLTHQNAESDLERRYREMEAYRRQYW